MKHIMRCTALLLALLIGLMIIPMAHAEESAAPPRKDPPPAPEGEYNPIVTLCLDANGGTFRNHQGMDLYDSEMSATPGTTLASTGYTIDRITCVDKDFRGWIAYDDSGKALSGLLTTQEVLNYTIPKHNIRFMIQWDKREGYPVTAITYAAIINGTGKPDPNVRVTLEVGGIRYSGYGYVTISKEVYSQWKGSMKVIWECPGQYIRANNRWVADYFEYESSVSSFKKGKSCYISISATGKGKDVTSPRNTINELFYSARNTQPEISQVRDASVTVYTSSSVAAPQPSITASQLQSGSTYDASMAAMKKATQTDHVLVFDITAKDASGKDIHQLGGTAEVTLPLPKSYTIQSGNTALVYYLPGDGTAVPCSTTLHDEDPDNRYLTFQTDHFSLYAVAEVAKAPDAPTQPDVPADQPTTPGVSDTSSTPVAPPAPKPTVQPEDIPVAPGDSGVVPTQPTTSPDAPANPTAPETPSAPETPTPPEGPEAPASPPAKPVEPAAPSTPADVPVDAVPASAAPVVGIAVAAVLMATAAFVLLKKRHK